MLLTLSCELGVGSCGLTFFFPDHGKMNNRLHRFLHIPDTYIFLPGMKGHFTGKDIRAGQSHKR